MKIAIIEDDKTFADFVSIVLGEHTKSFPEVEDFVDEGFEVIISDLRLVKTYGLETLTELRKKTDLPIIVLTGLGGPFLSATDMKAMLDAGAAEVWQKEAINDPAIKEMIEAVVKKHNDKMA